MVAVVDHKGLTEIILNRPPGVSVVYGNTTGGMYTVYSTSAATTVHHNNHDNRIHKSHDPFPWERRLALLDAFVRDHIERFGRFHTGWIPSKGHPGLQVMKVTDHRVPRQCPLDLRRVIQRIQTPRRSLAP